MATERPIACGLQTGKLHGGTVSCEECGHLLGYLSEENRSYYLHLKCGCGNAGYLLDRDRPLPTETEREERVWADQEKETILCPVCHRKLLSVNQRVESYGFQVVCACGRVFDQAYRRKRDLYQEQKEKI